MLLVQINGFGFSFQALAPVLFKDDDPAGAKALRDSPVAPAKRSNSAKAKASNKVTADHMPVHSFATLMEDLATVVTNRIQPIDTELDSFVMITKPTPLQQLAFDLLRVSPTLGYM